VLGKHAYATALTSAASDRTICVTISTRPPRRSRSSCAGRST
jgi:hypothetical protein